MNTRITRLIPGFLVAAFGVISLLIRVLFPYGQVFTGGAVKFTSIDAYFHMRLTDTLSVNFPNFTDFDPFFIFPGGIATVGGHFFDWLVAAFAWIFGAGSPAQHTIDLVGAYAPPVMAALTVIPVYFIGKALFNRWAGVMAAGLIAVLPGEYLGRSILGFTDHHVAEVLFTSIIIMFLVLAIKTGRKRELAFSHVFKQGFKMMRRANFYATMVNRLQKKDWNSSRRPILYVAVFLRILKQYFKPFRRPVIYALLAGVFLGIYLTTWIGGMFFIFIFALYFLVQFIINHLRGAPSAHLVITGVLMFLLALVIFVPLASPHRFMIAAMLIAILATPVLYGVSRFISCRGWQRWYYPAVIIGVGVIGGGLLYIIDTEVFHIIFRQFEVFMPSGASGATTMETQPFLSPTGEFSTSVAWGNFTTSFFLIPPGVLGSDIPFVASLLWYPGWAFVPIGASIWFYRRYSQAARKPIYMWLFVISIIAVIVFWFITPVDWKLSFPGFAFIGLGALIWMFVKKSADRESWVLLFTWTLVVLLATLGQRRFAYYFSVNVALLTAFFSWRVIWLAGLRNIVPDYGKDEKKPAKKDEKQASPGTSFSVYHINTILAVIVVVVLAFSFNIIKSKEVATAARFAPTDGWQSALTWMKDNTPAPMGDDDAYFGLYEAPAAGEEFVYPESAYSVTSWWDYGYWISRIAHRIPSVNPSQAAEPIRKVAGFFLNQDAQAASEAMADLNSRYIIIDDDMPLDKFWAIVTWNEGRQNDYSEVYGVQYGGELIPVKLFYPAYYETMVVRLYNFDAEAVTEVLPVVITYEIRTQSGGTTYKEISDIQEFDSYEEARAYLENLDTENAALVGTNPFISPIPLEALDDYELVYGSELVVPTLEGATTPQVKIFSCAP